VPQPQVERILAYLESAEALEIDPWLRDDLRIAWLTVLHADRGQSQPFVLASYRVLGIHPDKLQAALEARRRAQLGSLYVPANQWGDISEASSPKKPVQSERSPGWRLKKKA
jgi:hypothetical protein